MNKEFEIYKLTNINNNKIYIGVTTLGVSQRFKVHCWKASEGSNYPLHQAIKEHGKDAFRLEVIEAVESPTVAREKKNTLLNCSILKILILVIIQLLEENILKLQMKCVKH